MHQPQDCPCMSAGLPHKSHAVSHSSHAVSHCQPVNLTLNVYIRKLVRHRATAVANTTVQPRIRHTYILGLRSQSLVKSQSLSNTYAVDDSSLRCILCIPLASIDCQQLAPAACRYCLALNPASSSATPKPHLLTTSCGTAGPGTRHLVPQSAETTHSTTNRCPQLSHTAANRFLQGCLSNV